MHLTDNQETVMQVLNGSSGITTRALTDALGYPWTYDQVHGILARLENREIVVRDSRPAKWRITAKAMPVYRKEFYPYG